MATSSDGFCSVLIRLDVDQEERRVPVYRFRVEFGPRLVAPRDPNYMLGVRVPRELARAEALRHRVQLSELHVLNLKDA